MEPGQRQDHKVTLERLGRGEDTQKNRLNESGQASATFSHYFTTPGRQVKQVPFRDTDIDMGTVLCRLNLKVPLWVGYLVKPSLWLEVAVQQVPAQAFKTHSSGDPHLQDVADPLHDL